MNNENLNKNQIKNLLINHYNIILIILLSTLFFEIRFNDINEKQNSLYKK